MLKKEWIVKKWDEGNTISFLLFWNFCTDNHTEPHWANLILSNNPPIHPPPPPSPFSLFFVPKDSSRNLNQRWQVHSRAENRNKMQNKGRKHGKIERESREVKREKTFLAWHVCVFTVRKKIIKKSTFFYWVQKIYYLQPSHLGA